MISGLLGKKIGMTQIFDKDGNIVPVTALEVGPCYVLGLKDAPKKVVVGFDEIKEKHCSKPRLGFFKKANVPALRTILEFKSTDNAPYQVGQKILADFFRPGDYVTVIGTSVSGRDEAAQLVRWSRWTRFHASPPHRFRRGQHVPRSCLAREDDARPHG
jgi:large subunit ribosomal protein L3